MQCYMEKMNETELHCQHRLRRISTICGMKTHKKTLALLRNILFILHTIIFIEFLPRADAVLGTGDIAENKAK